MVISEAGADPKVTGLVYIAARAPEAGEDYPALTRRFSAAPAGTGLEWKRTASAREDRTVNPDLQRFMAKRMGATTIELASRHVSLLSHPREVARLILDAAHVH